MAREMKATFILKNLSDVFYDGGGLLDITGLLNMEDRHKFNYLQRQMPTLNITLKIGNGSFSDRVEMNQLLRTNPAIKFSLEPRRGYKLATFIFS